jgi:hypothetical protein
MAERWQRLDSQTTPHEQYKFSSVELDVLPIWRPHENREQKEKRPNKKVSLTQND